MPLFGARGSNGVPAKGPKSNGPPSRRRIVNVAKKNNTGRKAKGAKGLTLNDRFTQIKKRDVENFQKTRTQRRKEEGDKKRKQKRAAAVAKGRKGKSTKPKRGPKKPLNKRPVKTREELDQEMIELKESRQTL